VLGKRGKKKKKNPRGGGKGRGERTALLLAGKNF